jgi:hypothetical protein
MTLSEFENWFVKPLDILNADPHGGFAVLMIALPLAERYLREKSGCHEGTLNAKFYDEFHKLFPSLPREQVDKFWHAYRDGLLHQATFSKKRRSGTIMPPAWISSWHSTTPEIINYDIETNSFILLPKEFSQEIIRVIKEDFKSFLGAGSPNHPLPKVQHPPAWESSAKSPGSTKESPPATGVP